MGEKVEQQLKEVGSKLETPPTSKDSLIKLLKQATTCLPGIDQSPSTSTLESLQPFLDAIVKPELLNHPDRDVKLLVATCVCEITRITAPQAPYSDDVLKEIFHLIVGTFSGLSDTGSPSFGRRVFILDTLAKYRSCVVMLDLECEGLVNNMFSTFFAVAKDDHQENVLSSMQAIMTVLIEESEDIREDLLLIILSVLGRNRMDISGAARRLAMNVIESCAGKLEPSIKQCLLSLMSGDNRLENVKIDYHEVIYDVYRCAPQILSGIVPYLTGELLSDQLDTRLKAVGLVGELFALTKGVITEAFQPIFLEFVKRLTDREVGVRMSVLEYLKTCLLSNPCRPEASQIISALCDRLLDYDENVRKQVVDVICNVACASLDSIPTETVKLVAERLRDKSLFVKKHTMERIAEIFRVYCLKHSDGSIDHNEFDWIPGKILRCLYDRDFRSDVIESVLCGSLFPAEFSVKDRVNHWVKIFSLFDKVEVKALEKILEQKQRLQLEMQKYLALRKIHQDGDAPEIQKKVQFCFRVMSRLFAEHAKAEENFQILDQLKDSNIWKILTHLLDPNTRFNQASLGRDELLRILGEKHRLYDFLSNLSLKCSYLLFNKEHVKELLEAVAHRSTGNSLLTQSCMDLLVIISRFSPLLFGGSEEELVNLLKDDDEIIKESALNILAKAGGTIREQIPPSSIDLILEGFCLEGSRRQAKYAIHALVAITKDDGLKSLSVLYKRLVDMLEERRHLPAVMQSLGCIAEAAMPVFETRESEIQDFIKSKILNCSSKAEDSAKVNWDDRSEVCMLKVYGIKTLVKSYLPVKDAQLRPGIDDLIGMLRSILLFGEISKDIESSSVDKAHLRFAAAKAVLRLSKQWDHKIPADVFHSTVVMPEFTFPEARKLFLGKVYQYMKDRLLDAKYACAFLFNKESFQSLDIDERQNLTDIIQMHHQAKTRQVSGQSDANPLESYPEYILPYLVHTLAHHSCPSICENKDVKTFEPLYRQLYLFLSVLLYKDEEVKSEASANKEKESVSTIVSIFQSIKNSEDQVEVEKSKNSHCIAEIGLSIVKRFIQKVDDVQESKPSVPLPPMLYKQFENTDDVEAEANKGKTWLPDESFLAHFESLKFDASGTVIPEIAEDGVSKDSETEANEVPLGKIIKQLKSESKSGKVRKEKSSPAKEKKAESGVDILKMVREINLDSLGLTSKFESSNGHNHFESEDNLEQQKEKKRKTGHVTPVTVPKKRRSVSIHNASRSSQKVPRTFHIASNHDARDKKPAPKVSIESTESDLLVSSIKKGRSITSKKKRRNSDLDSYDKTTEVGEADDTSDVETDRVTTNVLKSPTGSSKKRNRSTVGLTKCTTKETGVDFEDLAGHRIKVWWPMDKKFYEGTVKSFDPLKRKHVILYDDGDIEVLNLERERWELVDSGPKQSKKPKSSKRPTSVSPAQKNKKSGGSRQNNKSMKTEKSKGTPKKKKVLQAKHEEKDDSFISKSDPSEASIGSERKSGDSNEVSAEPRTQEVTDKEESDKEVISNRRSKHLGDGKKSPTSFDDSDGESNSKDSIKVSQESAKGYHHSEASRDESDSEDDHADKEKSDSEDIEQGDVVITADKGLIKSKKANKKTSKPKNKREPEISDDEPLLKWKQKAGKSRKLAK